MDVAQATEFYRAGKLAEAERTCQTILAGDAGNAPALSLLGMLRCRMGQPKEGIGLLRRAVERRPDAAELLSNLAYGLGLCGRDAEAAAVIERSLQVGGRQTPALYNLGVARERAGQLVPAEKAYREAVALLPTVVSLTGPTFASRAGLSLLSAVGLGELACETADEYVRCAMQLATDRERLATLRRELRPRMEHSPLRDERGYARAVEAANRAMWARWCNEPGQPAMAT